MAIEEDELTKKWEAKQLIASRVLNARKYLMFDDDGDGLLYKEEGVEEELEIKLNKKELAFLQG